jgi:hypothetical protein
LFEFSSSKEMNSMAGMFHPRNDFVLLRLIQADKSAGGVVLPEKTQEGVRWKVVEVGPDVKGLEEGQLCFIIGTLGEDVVALPRGFPGAKGLVVTRQSNVVLILDDGDEPCVSS